MNDANTTSERWNLGPKPDRSAALIDIIIYLALAFAFWGIEEALRAADLFPYPGLFDGGPTLVASFFVVVGPMKWRGQGWGDFGLIHFQWGAGGMVGTAIMGSALGLMYLATKRNLWPLIAGHAALDAILMAQVYYGVI